MSTTVDQRVVEMRFDNKQFESNVSTTMSSLDKLKQSLDLTGASKGLEEVNSAAKKCDMSALGGAVETVKTKFSSLQIMAVTALANITNSAVNYGKRIVSALTIDPIKTGFSEYETQINAIQTILANTEKKGTTLSDVNSALDELNTYADKTIYNFTEMTRNIGTFTAAGVDLDTSVSAIKGIANLAAVSGSTSQQASTAMYQLSQAMSSGTVRLMDWNSVVNAGMGGQVFQDALKETAKVHGVAIDDIIKKQGSFRESLSEGWLTTEILTETLKKFTGDLSEEQLKSMGYTEEQIKSIIKTGQTASDAATKVKTFTQLFDTLKEAAQSGWSQTWRILVGDFEEAREVLTKVSDTIGGIIGDSAEARNELLENWKVLGGRTDVIEAIKNTFNGIVDIVTVVKDAFREIFPPITAEQLAGFTEGLKNLTEKFKLSDATSDKLKRTFKGLFAVVDIVRQILVAAVKAVASLFGVVGKVSDGVLDVTSNFGDWLVKLNDVVKSGDVFNKIFKFAAKLIKAVLNAASDLANFINEYFIFPSVEVFSSLLDGIREKLSGVSDSANGMKNSIARVFGSIGSAITNSSLFELVKILAGAAKGVLVGTLEAVGSAIGGIIDLLANADFNGLSSFVSNLASGGALVGIVKIVYDLLRPLRNFSDIIDGFSEVLDGFGDVLNAFSAKVKADALKTIAISIAILAASILVLSAIEEDKLTNAISGLTMLFAELLTSFSLFNKLGETSKSTIKGISAIVGISIAVLILSSALKKVSSLTFDDMTTGLIAITGLMALVVGAAKVLATDEKAVVKGATQMLIFAAAIKVLAGVCWDLAMLNWEELAKGLLGVATLLAGVIGFIKLAGNSGGITKNAIGMVLIAAALKIMASVCSDFADMHWEEMAKGLFGIATLLIGIIGFTKLIGKPEKLMSTSLSLIALSAGMKILASAMLDIGGLTWEGLFKGLLGIASAVSIMIATLEFMPTNTLGKVASLIAVSLGIGILADALVKMGRMSWSSVVKSIGTMGASLLILVVGLKAMEGTARGSAALIVAAIAVNALVPALIMLGGMSWSSIARGLTMLAGTFAVLGVASYALSYFIDYVWGAVGVLAVASMALLGIGAALVLAGAGLSSIAVGISAIIAAVAGGVSTLTGALHSIIKSAASLIPYIIEQIGKGLVLLLGVIADALPIIGDVVTGLVLMLCDVLIECVPKIVETIDTIVLALLASLVKMVPKIVDSLLQILIGVQKAIAQRLPEFIQTAVDILMALFQGVIDALKTVDMKVLLDGLNGIGILSILIAALAGVAGLIPLAMLGVLGMGLVIAELAIVLSTLGALAQLPGLLWIIGEGGKFLQVVGKAIGRFIGGIVDGFAKASGDGLTKIGEDLSDFMASIQPFLDGVKGVNDTILSSVKALVSVILAMTAANILERMTAWVTGGSSISKFATELPILGMGIKGFSDAVKGVSAENVLAATDAAKALAQMTAVIPNSGGMVSWFTGDNSVAKFGSELPILGMGLKSFSDSVNGISPENVTAAANAAKAIAEMTSVIPNSGGVVSWFSGDNSVAKFGSELPVLGLGLKSFSESVTGLVPENVLAAVDAARALAEMTTIIPNSGGVTSWFSGDNSVAQFGAEIVLLGMGLKGFSTAVMGISSDNVKMAIEAAKSLADMANTIPNQGGIKSWFSGDNSVASFAPQLPMLGIGLKGFSDSIIGIVPENVTAAANAAKAIAQMTAVIPNEGGIKSWFSGDNSVASFASRLPVLGTGLKGFSDKVTGIVVESVTAGANAAKTLAQMTAIIPNEGGIKSWFTGDNSVTSFANKLPNLGRGLKGFADEVTGIVPENVTAAANSAKALAEMTAIIPNEGGIKSWFTGETSISNFAGKLPSLGKGLKGFSDSVEGITPENVTAAADAAQSLAEMTDTVPNNTDKIIDFGENLTKFGGSLKSYFSKTADISAESISGSKSAIDALKQATTVDSGNIKSTAKAIEDMADAIRNLARIPKDATSSFRKAMKELGESCVTSFIEELESMETGAKDAANEAMKGFASGVEDGTSKAKSACTSAVKKCAEAMTESTGSFSSAGKDLVEGFASGISKNTYLAEAKARAMARAAARAAKEALDINSPSKVFREIGMSVPEGFAQGIDKLGNVVNDSSVSMTKGAVDNVKESISRIAEAVNGDMDVQPTIRPVLDLSNIRSGAGAISNMLGAGSSVGLLANVGAISSTMSRRNQNGGNNDVVSAIGKLHDDMKNAKGDTYSINLTGYDAESEVAEALRIIVRAAKMERRS